MLVESQVDNQKYVSIRYVDQHGNTILMMDQNMRKQLDAIVQEHYRQGVRLGIEYNEVKATP